MHVVAEAGADETLAGAGAGQREGRVVGEGADPGNRRVADAARMLVGEAAGGRRRGQVTVAITRHGADGAVFLAVGAQVPHIGGVVVIERDDAFGVGVLQLAEALLRHEIIRRDFGQAELARERLGTGAGEQHVRASLHHGARQLDRALHARNPRHRAAGAIHAIHDRGVEFGRAFAVQHGADAGVEQRAFLQLHHAGLDRVERAAAAAQHCHAGCRDFAQRGFMGARVGALGGVAGAAVDGQPQFLAQVQSAFREGVETLASFPRYRHSRAGGNPMPRSIRIVET